MGPHVLNYPPLNLPKPAKTSEPTAEPVKIVEIAVEDKETMKMNQQKILKQ